MTQLTRLHFHCFQCFPQLVIQVRCYGDNQSLVILLCLSVHVVLFFRFWIFHMTKKKLITILRRYTINCYDLG